MAVLLVVVVVVDVETRRPPPTGWGRTRWAKVTLGRLMVVMMVVGVVAAWC